MAWKHIEWCNSENFLPNRKKRSLISLECLIVLWKTELSSIQKSFAIPPFCLPQFPCISKRGVFQWKMQWSSIIANWSVITDEPKQCPVNGYQSSQLLQAQWRNIQTPKVPSKLEYILDVTGWFHGSDLQMFAAVSLAIQLIPSISTQFLLLIVFSLDQDTNGWVKRSLWFQSPQSN